jgi:hypothetical protein
VAPGSGGRCGLCSGDETAQPRQCATLRDAIDHRGGVQAVGGCGCKRKMELGVDGGNGTGGARRAAGGVRCMRRCLEALYR